MHTRTVSHSLVVSVRMLRYHTRQGGYSIGLPAFQYCCSHPWGWELNFLCETSYQVRNLFHMSSCRWLSWTAPPIHALTPQGLVRGMIWALDAPEEEVSPSLWDSAAQDYVSAMDTSSIIHRSSWESCFVPYSPPFQGYSPTTSTAVTPLQLSQSAVCISLLLPPRWKSC